jgi:oligopeptidase B
MSNRFEEWGDPRNLDIYEIMKTYCPYTNIDGEKLARNEYPNLLVVGGMNDPRVAFFEPLKFVAKMRGEKKKWKDILTKKGLIRLS